MSGSRSTRPIARCTRPPKWAPKRPALAAPAMAESAPRLVSPLDQDPLDAGRDGRRLEPRAPGLRGRRIPLRCTARLSAEASAASGGARGPPRAPTQARPRRRTDRARASHAGGAAASRSLHTSLSGPGAPVLGSDEQVPCPRRGDVDDAAALGVEVGLLGLAEIAVRGLPHLRPSRLIAQPRSSRAMRQAPWSIRVSQARRPSQSTTTGNSSPFAWCTVRIWTASAPHRVRRIELDRLDGPFAHPRGDRVEVQPVGRGELARARGTARAAAPRRWAPFGPSATTRANAGPIEEIARRRRPAIDRTARAAARGSARAPRRAARSSPRESPCPPAPRAPAPGRSGSSAKNGGRSSAASATPSSRIGEAARARAGTGG